MLKEKEGRGTRDNPEHLWKKRSQKKREAQKHIVKT